MKNEKSNHPHHYSLKRVQISARFCPLVNKQPTRYEGDPSPTFAATVSSSLISRVSLVGASESGSRRTNQRRQKTKMARTVFWTCTSHRRRKRCAVLGIYARCSAVLAQCLAKPVGWLHAVCRQGRSFAATIDS
jgi:hypothetical protein